MNRLAVVVALLLGIAPAVASAALSLQIGPRFGEGMGNTDVIPVFPLPGEQFLDLVFNETGAADNEGLFAYDLLLTSTQGVNLVRAEKPDNWVFTAPDASFSQAEADARHILVNGINTLTGSLSDITQGTKAARVFYTLGQDFPGIGYIRLDPNVTTFGSGDPNRDLVIPVDISDPGIIGIPEPAGLTLLGVFGVAALHRRRTAGSLDRRA